MFKVSKICNRIVHEYKCLFLAFILFKLRESGKQKFGCKGKMSQSYLSYFFDGVPLENSLLSRANRLCIAFNAGLRDSGLSCLSLLSLARSEMAIVRLPRDLSKKLLFLYFSSVEGKGTPLPFGVPRQSFGFIFSFPFRCPATQGHLSANICVTHNHF